MSWYTELVYFIKLVNTQKIYINFTCQGQEGGNDIFNSSLSLAVLEISHPKDYQKYKTDVAFL